MPRPLVEGIGERRSPASISRGTALPPSHTRSTSASSDTRTRIPGSSLRFASALRIRLSATLSKSERRDHPDAPWRRFQYDQTHILTLVGSYKFGRGYQVGLRFRYVTGNPYTPVVGAYYDVNQDTYVPLRGPTYSGRLGAFHQLDVRFDKTWTYRQFRFSLYVDVQNVYNASVPEGVAYNFDYSKTTTINGLPFLPVLGIRGDF